VTAPGGTEAGAVDDVLVEPDTETAGTEAAPVAEHVEREAGAAGDGTGGSGGRTGADPLVHLTGTWRILIAVGAALAVATGIVLRFIVHSPLWLDEALTVNISKLPLHDLHAALKQDGAPPLYYVLLHFWMKVFGSSDGAVRSLSGVLSVATLPVAWVAARKYGGRTVAWVTLLLLASAPFAIFYGTEARMYALVMFLTACGFVALERALDKPRVGNLVAVGVVTAALLYSQYWAMYLVALVAIWVLRQAVRRVPPGQTPPPERANARWTLLALAAGGLAFVPWLPTFFFQSAHTGTPWAKPPNFSAVVSAVTGFTNNQASNSLARTNVGALLALIYFALGALGLFGLGRDRWHVTLDLRTRPQARSTAFVVVGTLALAVTGAIITTSAFSNRYAAVVFVPLLMLIALGSLTLIDVRIRTIVIAVAVVAGLIAGAQNIDTQRTQAQKVATMLAAHAKPGDVVAFCPDQLGPSVARLVPPGRYRMVAYPRSNGPEIVNWVDYRDAINASSPEAFARLIDSKARSGGHQIWLVWNPNYQEFGSRCQRIIHALELPPGAGAKDWVDSNSQKYYEPMQLTQFNPGS
jgi:hypothetical protein